MKTEFVLRFTTENAAFTQDAAGEVSRILHAVAVRVFVDAATENYGRVYDSNGNSIGEWAYDTPATEHD